MRYLVILDDGHGLIDTPGKRTPLFPDGTYMTENEFSSVVVDKIYGLSKKYMDIDVIFTASEKRDVSLNQRVERVNNIYEGVKEFYDKIVLISVHANAMKDYWNDIGNGTATFYYPGNMIDKAFAEVIQENLIASTKLKPHRGGVVAENFQIIREVKCTAVLCECAFMDNLVEAKLLLTDEFRQACAEGITNGLLEYFGINQKKEADNMVRYKKYSDGIYELRGEVKDLGVKVVNKSNRAIEEPNCTNGTFFWHINSKEKYSTSILYADGKLYQAAANHLPYPQSVYIVYKNDIVDLKLIKNISELNLDKIRLVIGGVGIRNIFDSTFKYSPASEGFKGVYADVLRRSNKTFIGYNKRLNKQYLLVLKNVTMAEAISIMTDNSTGEAYDIILMVDGGGSTTMRANNETVLMGDGRKIHNILYFD